MVIPDTVDVVDDEPGQIKLWLDDEREPRTVYGTNDGWTVCRSFHEAMDVLERDHAQVSQMSLDWHLGDRQPDGVFFANEVVSRVRYLSDFEEVFKTCRRINCHSSDRDRRREMALIFLKAQEEHVLSGDIRVSIHAAK